MLSSDALSLSTFCEVAFSLVFNIIQDLCAYFSFVVSRAPVAQKGHQVEHHSHRNRTTCIHRNRKPCNSFFVVNMASGAMAVGGAVASWLVHLTPERAVQVRALAGDIVLFSWARHFTLTVLLSTQVYKWVLVLANLMLGVTLRWTSIPSRGE